MLDRLKKKLPLKEGSWPLYEPCFRRIELPARSILLREGEVARRAYFIEKGCLRVWFSSDGREVSFQFFFEGDRVSSAESFKKNIPSLVNIETIEPSVVWAIDKKDMDRMTREAMSDPGLSASLIDSLYERNFHYMKHCLSFVRDSPAQRYMNLIRESPMIVQRVPQHYIASYLGISTVHLSRIRSSMQRKPKQ